MKLIPKDAVFAEIENRIKSANNDVKIGAIESLIISKTLNGFKSFLNTLEVKEVDLEKEIKKVQRDYKTIDEYEGYFATIYASDIEWVAKHFFELGLKAQKGE